MRDGRVGVRVGHCGNVGKVRVVVSGVGKRAWCLTVYATVSLWLSTWFVARICRVEVNLIAIE